MITISSDDIQANEVIRIAGPDNEFVPNYNISGNMISMEFPPSKLSPGYYHVLSGKDTIRSLAINHSKLESDLRQFTEDELEAFASASPNIEALEIQNRGDYTRQLQAGLSNI